MKHIFNRLTVIIGLLVMFVGSALATNSFLEETQNYSVTPKGNGVVHFKIPIWAYGRVNNYRLGYGTSLWYSGTYNKTPTSGVTHFMYIRSTDTQNTSDPNKNSTAEIRVSKGTVKVTKTSDGGTKQIDSGTDYQKVELSAQKSMDGSYQRVVFLEFDWYVPQDLSTTTFYAGVDGLIYKYDANDKSEIQEMNIWYCFPDRLDGADDLIAPELQSPYLYFMNEEGNPVREGKAAIPYVVYQTPKSYTTSFNSQSVTVNNRAGSIIVATADTIQRNFKATFTVQPNSDVSTTVERSTNAINIPAYHRIYDFAVKEGKDAQGSYTGAKTLSWTIRNPQAEDLMSTDYFEIQRAQKEDYSDAQTIQLLPMTPDSSTYTYVDETTVPAGTAVTEDSLQRYYNIDYKNYVLKSEEGEPLYSMNLQLVAKTKTQPAQPIYYRVRRASASAWDWDHPFAQQTTLQQHSYLAPLALTQPNYTLDPDFENNRKVHFNIKIDNAQITDAPIVPADCELTPEFVENKMPIDSITLNVNVTPAFHEAVSYIKFQVGDRHEVNVWGEGMQTIKLPYCSSGSLRIDIKGRWYNTYLFNGCGNDFVLEIIRLTEQKMVEMDGGLYTFILDSRDRYSGGWVYEGHAEFTPNQGTKVIPAVVTDRWNEVKDTVKQMMFEKLTEKYRTTVYGRCTWDRGAKLVLRRTSVESGSEIEFIVPQDSIRRNEDGSWTAHFTDIANMACTHYTYTAQIDPSDAELRFQNPNSTAPVAINGPSLYFDEAATITSFTASQGLTDGENKRGVQLKWSASAPSVDEFILLRIPQGSSNVPDTIYRGAEVTWFDQTAVPGQRYEYTVVARYECNGRRTDNNATAIGWRTEFGEIRGVVTQTDNSGMSGVTVSLSGNGLTRSMVTGASGAFVFDSLPYDVTTGAIYTITPTSQYGIFSYNNTSSGVASVALDSKNCIASGVNFVNTSCVRLTGRVLYDMSTIPVADAYFLLNGDTIRRNGKAYLTGIDGSFELTVPKSMPCRLQVAKAGHTFKNDGWLFVTENDTTFSLVKPLDGVRLYDRTKVRLVGRVAGGIDQQQLPPALGLGKNNLGDDLQLVLMLEGDNTAHVVHNPDDLTQDTLQFAIDNLSGHTSTIYQQKRIVIRPDSKTGEYAVDLYPVKYKVTQATANGYATLLNIEAGAPTVNLINAPLQTLRSDSGDLHATYNAVYDCIYRSPMQVGVVQYQAGMPQDGYGEKTLPVSNLLNLSKNVDVYTVDSTGAVEYLLDYPVFQQGRTYQFRVSVYEDYIYNNDPTSSTDRVRLNGGQLKIYNGFKSGENTATAIYPLNEAGEANIQVEVDNLSLLATGSDALRTLDLSIEREGGSIDYRAIRGFVTGNYVENGDIRAVTADIKVLDVLRDPPGSGSSCSLEKGASYKSVNPFAITLKAGINLNFKIGTAYNQSVGVVSTVSYSGVSVSAGKTNAFTLPLVASIKYNSSYTYTYSNSEKISTGSSPSFVGADADVFVGHATEVLYGTIRAVRIIDDTTYQLRKPAIDAGYIKEIASARTADGTPYHFVIAKETVLGSRVGTDFAYTQGHIANKILPNLVAQRNALLVNAADSAAAQEIANARKAAVYWNIATDESKIGLDTTTYKVIKPTNVPDFVEVDKVKAINNVIVKWVSILATNEREKVVARQSGKHVGTFSVSGGTNHDYSESYSADWSMGGNMSYGTPDFGTLFKQVSSGIELVGSMPVGKAIINLLNDRMKAGDNGAIIDINGVAVGAQWKTEVTPVFNIDTDIPLTDHSGSESVSRKISFNIVPDSYGYTTVSVYRAPADSVFLKQIGSWKQYMNMYSNATDYKYGSFIFFQEGGSSHCPYEGEVRTKWYKPGMFVLGNATLPMENPKITLDQHSISNVPADQAAVFRVTLVNDNLNTDGRPAKGQYLSLSVEPQTNPDGAIILMDGEPLTSASTLTFFCEPGVPIVKTMQVKRGIVDDYEDLTIKLASTTCASIGTLAKFSVHFMPESSPVSISYPRDKWVMNTLSARDSIGYYLPITIDGFNIHHKNFDHIEFQYKLSTENNDAWVNACSFYADDSLYNIATGNKAKIENGRITPFRFYGERDPKELDYDLRAVSFCRYGSGFVTKESPVISGIKDTRPPVLFGKPLPANGILKLDGDIKLRFSEPIAGNWLDEDNNFQILGVTNATGITQTTSLYFDGQADHYAASQASRELAITDLTIDMLIKPAEKNREMILFAHGNEEESFTFSLTADNRLKLSTESYGKHKEYLSKQMEELSANDFTRVIMTYELFENEIHFYAGTKDVTDNDFIGWVLQDEAAPLRFGAGLKGENPFHGNLMEVRLWTKALSPAEIANTHLRRLTGYEHGLLAYYPLSESKGNTMDDLASGATLTAKGLSWTNPQGISLATNGNKVRLQPTLFSRTEAEDYTFMCWFRSDNASSDKISLFGTAMGDSVTMQLAFGDGAIRFTAGDVDQFASADLTDGNWHHCVLVISKTYNSGTLYIDNRLILMFPTIGIGALAGTSVWIADGLEGNIDDVCLFEQALPAELIAEYGKQTPNGEEMGLINLLTFSRVKRNSSGVMEQVFSPDNQRVFRDANGNVVSKVQPLLIDDLTTQADKSNYAPVRDRGLLTNLPFNWTYQESDLLINIKTQPREINKRTMFLTVRDVEDLNGNRLPSPVMWTVYANLNSIVWGERSLQMVMDYEQSSAVRSSITIVNQTGMTRQYTIDHLPKWLSVSPAQGTLEAEDEKTVTFTVTEVLKPGIHNHVVYLTDDQGLSEPLLIEVEVIAECPYEEPETGKFPYNMSLCGQVKIGDVFDTDPEDKVIALYNNECVGMANVDFDRITNKSSVHLTVFGDDKMNRKQIHFRLWQASTGKMYNLSADRNILFAHGFVYGCDGNRVVFTAGGSETQNISLHSGWNWISTNLDLSATKGDLNTCVTAAKPWSDADLIKNPNSRQFSSYDAASDAFVGSLAGLHFSQMYMMYAAQENTLQIAGEKLSADSLSIRVRGDGQWSPMPCLFDEPVSVTKALTSYYDYASQGDMIKAHNRFAYFSEDKKWEGDLTSLRPGEGYLFRRLGLGSKEIKFYRQSSSAPKRSIDRYADRAQNTDLFNNPQAASNMTMIATLDDGQWTLDKGQLKVYVGGELSAIASPIDSLYFITIQSDRIGELRFEIAGERLMVDGESIRYTADSHYGTLKAPIVLRKADETGVYKILENNHVVIIRNNEKYDVTGKKL